MMLLDPETADEALQSLQCQECGGYVSESFARVFGDNQDRVEGCPSCTTFRERSEGGITPTESPSGVDTRTDDGADR